jgi:hypothetical protein
VIASKPVRCSVALGSDALPLPFWLIHRAVLPPKAWKLSDGSDWASTWVRSCWPTDWNAALPMIWIGAALSAARVPVVRVPVTMISVLVAGASVAGASSAGAGA